MSKRKFDEITKARIGRSKNAVISRIERSVRTDEGKKVEKGYLIAQQMEIEELGEITRVFIKGGSMTLPGIDAVVSLRDALNRVLEEEGYRQSAKSPKSCEKSECKDPRKQCGCTGEEEISNKGKKPLVNRGKDSENRENREDDEVADQLVRDGKKARKDIRPGKSERREGFSISEPEESDEYDYQEESEEDEDESEEESSWIDRIREEAQADTYYRGESDDPDDESDDEWEYNDSEEEEDE